MTTAPIVTKCKREVCRNLVTQVPGNHRRRQYCSATCKQADYRGRTEEKGRERKQAELCQRWGNLLPETLRQLDLITQAMSQEAAQQVAAAITVEKQQQGTLLSLEESEGQRERIRELEQQLGRYHQVIDLDAICPWTALTPVQEYLRDHDETVPFRCQGKTIRIGAIDNHGRAVSDRHGLIRLNGEEIEQCRLYALKKLGQPILVTVHPVRDGGKDSEPLEAEEQGELQQAQARILEIKQQLARYRQICDLSDRARLEQQFLDIGEQIGYRRLIPAGNDVAVGEGSEFWRTFAESADDEELARTTVRARHYAENLVWIDAQTELEQAKRRIAELERQLTQSALQSAP